MAIGCTGNPGVVATGVSVNSWSVSSVCTVTLRLVLVAQWLEVGVKEAGTLSLPCGQERWQVHVRLLHPL